MLSFKICSGILKYALLFTYIFSATPFYVLFVITALISLFYQERENSLVFISTILVFGLLFASILLLFFLNYPPFFCFVKKIMGSTFLDMHFPISFYNLRGARPLIIYVSTLFLFLFIDSISLHYCIELQYMKIAELKEKRNQLPLKDETFEKLDVTLNLIDESKKLKDVEGILRSLINHSTIAHYINIFSWKKC